MLKIIPFKIAVNLTITILSTVLIFHFLIMAGIIPYDYVWAGKLNNKNEVYVFEGISIVVNLFFMLVILLKSRIIKWRISYKIVNLFLWLMTIMFFLNTLGNLFAEKTLEFIFGTLLTCALAILCLRMALEKE